MKKAIVVADKTLVIMHFIGMIVMSVFALGVIISAVLDVNLEFYASEIDRIRFPLLFVILALAFYATEIIIAPRWCRWYVFKGDCFECKSLFRKKTVVLYKDIHISSARYFHGTPVGLGSYRYYLVFATRSLSRYEHDNINQISPDGVYKISFSKQNVKKLRTVLNGNLLEKLNATVNTINRMSQTEAGNGFSIDKRPRKQRTGKHRK